jgi:glycosyltransferase involved in cell wall biosynthesis
MNAVIVDGDISYPPTSGKRLRTLHLMQRLARRHRVTYIARNASGSSVTRSARDYLQDHGIETVFVEHPLARKAGPAFFARLALNLLSPLPYSVASHRSAPMREAVTRYAATHAVDVWQFEWPPYLATLPDPHARKVVIAHNVDTLIWQRFHETETRPLRKLFLRQQWRKFERYERRAFKEADWVVAVSEDDARLIREQFGMRRVEVVDNGIDRAAFEAVTPNRDANRILFLGALDWRPNLDAVQLLLDRIFPEVRRLHPDARLDVVGRNPPAGLAERVQALPGAQLHADVADVRPYLAEAGVMAVPLRIGGGSRLKILEALACGLPVVSSAVGAEGLCLEPGRDLVIVPRAEDSAAALVEALRAPERAQAQARQGRQVVLERYDWDALALKLEQVWEKCARSPERGPSPAAACGVAGN